MFVLKMRDIIIFILLICIVIFFCFLFNTKNMIETVAKPNTNIIVIDAGHGLPDGGATANGILESELNLKIAMKLKDELNNLGYKVVMTRENENNIADSDKQNSISQTKQSDLTNRVKRINESNADLGISIHLNKYSDSKYWGWQTFYSENSKARKNSCKFNSGRNRRDYR